MPPKTRFEFRHQYDDVRDAEERKATDKNQEGQISLTQQQYTEDVNLNVMVARMGITDGAIPPVAIDPKYFGDFTDAVDFREAWDRVRIAEMHFQQLPAEIRTRFQNDPVQLHAFIQDPKNDEEAVKMGLLHRMHEKPVGGAPATGEGAPK